jgi:hypothetical protein
MSAGTVVVWAFAGEAESTRKVEANIRTTKTKANIFTLELRQKECLLVSNMFSFISFSLSIWDGFSISMGKLITLSE